ncbi:hypothetical protein J3E69DRAFT_321022 [Trichoderma sp. SZMC 28015]
MIMGGVFRLLYSIIFLAAAAEVVLSHLSETSSRKRKEKNTTKPTIVSKTAGGAFFLFSFFLPFFNPSWDSTASVLRCLLQWPLPETPTPVQHAQALQRKQVSPAV